jgi:20S proteasome alpha/beta subunit
MNFVRYEMSTVDAIDLARRAIVHAAHRDAASGNIVRSRRRDSFLSIVLKSLFI